MSIPFRSWRNLTDPDATTRYIEQSLLDVLSANDQSKINAWLRWLKIGYDLQAISYKHFQYFIDKYEYYLEHMEKLK